MTVPGRIFPIVVLVFLCSSLWGQTDRDSLFRLVQAEYAEQETQYGMNYRRVQGNAKFLHNDTYLLCDSASWNVDTRIIEAFGNVQIIQNNTMLHSEEMIYYIEKDLARFRGGLVELFDKDGNILRTDMLDYDTRDSVAIFRQGGAMKDGEGNVIEGRTGIYDGKVNSFTFQENVEMYMDSIDIKTTSLKYMSREGKAYFGSSTYMWQDPGFIKADAGWYDRNNRMVYFANRVYMNDDDYEAWTDEVYYDQVSGKVDMYTNSQILDTANRVIYLGDHLKYLPAEDSLSARVTMAQSPAVVYFGENENHQVDTLFMTADSIFAYTVKRCDVPEAEVSAAQQRVDDLLYDALSKKREEEAVKREEERIEKLREYGKLPPEWVEEKQKAEADSIARVSLIDSLKNTGLMDSLSIAAYLDSIDGKTEAKPAEKEVAEAPSDSVSTSEVVPEVKDTTALKYVVAYYDVRMYRTDLQGKCDSLVFTEVDSIARLFGKPVLWNAGKNQLMSEDMSLLMKDGNVRRGSMITDAWVISQVDSLHFNQIKSTEMLGYFHENQLYRFDALGGVNAMFYLDEDGVLTTLNQKEAKSMIAAIKNGEASRLLYLETIKSDAYPVSQIEIDRQRLKDFKWRGDERPQTRLDITARNINPTGDRSRYKGVTKPRYKEVDHYFDGYMTNLRKERRKAALERQKAREEAAAEEAAIAKEVEEIPADRNVLEKAPAVPAVDSVGVSESGAKGQQEPALEYEDSVEKAGEAIAISLKDAVATPEVRDDAQIRKEISDEPVVKQLSAKEKKAVKRAERKARKEAIKKARREAREAAKAEKKARREAKRAAKAAARAARHKKP